MIKQIKTSIKINATAQKVWEVLMDFEKYSEWNPFISAISGNRKEGETLKVQIKNMTFKPKILVLKENQEFKWLGHFLFKGVFDGEHRFKLTENSDGSTIFEQNENFKGFLVPFFTKTLKETKLGFESMNKELKIKAENS